jgi:hypothetical protein
MKLILAAAATLLVATPAFAGYYDTHYNDWNTRFNCTTQFYKAQDNSPLWGRTRAKMKATAPNPPERFRLRDSAEGRAMIRAANYYCGVRGM